MFRPKRGAQLRRQGMIRGKALDMVLQRVQPRRRKKARLPHPAAQEFAVTPCIGDEQFRPKQQRADRRAEPLAETHRHRIETGADGAGSIPHGAACGLRLANRRVEQACAIEVGCESVCLRQCTHRLQVSKRQDATTVGVLHHHQPRAREVRIIGLDGAADVFQRERAIRLVRQGLRLDAAEHRHAARLPAVGVPELANDGLVAAPAMPHQSGEVRLRAARQEKRGLETEPLCCARLQGVDRGVIAVDVVAHLGIGHGAAHLRRGPRDGIAAEITHVRGNLVRGASRLHGTTPMPVSRPTARA
jgi:hypothetical protein